MKKIDENIFFLWEEEEIFYEIVKKNYGVEANSIAESILRTIKLRSEKELIHLLIGNFIGIGETDYSKNIKYLFLKILKNSKIQIDKLLLKNHESFISLNKAFKYIKL